MRPIIPQIPFPLRVILAILLFALALVGFALPLLQGWLFVGLGIYFLCPEKGTAIFHKVRDKTREIKKRLFSRKSPSKEKL